MSQIDTKELRKMANCTMFIEPDAGALETCDIMHKAADEIDTLRAQLSAANKRVEGLEKALKGAEVMMRGARPRLERSGADIGIFDAVLAEAQAALSGGGEE